MPRSPDCARQAVSFRNDVVTGPGGKQILLDDPSGNPIELFQRPRACEPHGRSPSSECPRKRWPRLAGQIRFLRRAGPAAGGVQAGRERAPPLARGGAARRKDMNTRQLTTLSWVLIAIYASVTILRRSFAPDLLPSPVSTVLITFVPVIFVFVHGSLSYRLRDLLVFAAITLVVSNIFENLSVLIGISVRALLLHR